MPQPQPESNAALNPKGSPGYFATTHWSVVLATRDSETTLAAAALEKLCGTYWYPLYAYLRRRGFSEPDAQDLTQGFFAQLLRHGSIQGVNREKGKFRSFLLASLNYFLADARDQATAQKRGGGCEMLSLNTDQAEARYRLEPVDERTPEKIFEQRWAVAVLDQVLARLAQEFACVRKAALFEHLQPFLIEVPGAQTYAGAGAQAGMSEEAFKKAVQRMRHRYRQLFREEIAQTVASPAEVEEELRHLCQVLGE